MKNRIVAGLLALFFGGFGVHKFYLRDSGAGIFYLILMFVGAGIRIPISMFLGWIDALVLFTMSEEKFDEKYNKKYEDRMRRRYDRYEPRSNRRYPSREEYNRPSARQRTQRPQRSYEVRREREEFRPRQRTPQKPPPRRRRDNPFKKTGISKYKEYDIEGAIEDFNKGLELDPNDIALHFNLACAYSISEKPDKSYYHLSKAVENGFKDFEKIKTHDDLAYLRIQEGFEEFANNGYTINATKTIPVTDKAEDKPVELPQDDVLLSQLQKLSELRNKGLLSEKEFILEKEKLMRR